MLGKKTDPYVTQFEKLCGGPNDDLSVKDARKIVLFRSQGALKASMLVDAATGNLLPLPEVCQNTMSIVKKATEGFWRKRADMDEYVEMIMTGEKALYELDDNEETLDKVCKITPKQRQTLRLIEETLMYSPDLVQNEDSVAGYRRALLSSDLDVRGIHLFHMDGSSRNASGGKGSIQWALCHHAASTSKGMSKAVNTAIVMGVVVFLVSAYFLRNDEGRKKAKAKFESGLDYLKKGGFIKDIKGLKDILVARVSRAKTAQEATAAVTGIVAAEVN